MPPAPPNSKAPYLSQDVAPLRGDLSTAPGDVGLVLSGGGARGAFHVGVWEVLSSAPAGLHQLPAVISGTSAGAINGMLIAAGLNPSEMLEFWLSLAKKPPVTANAAFFQSVEKQLRKVFIRQPLRSWRQRGREARLIPRLLSKHLSMRRSGWLAMGMEYMLTARFDGVSDLLDGIASNHLFSTAPFRRRLMDTVGGSVLSDPKVRLAINAVDVHTGKPVRFCSHPVHKHSDADASHYHEGPISVDMVLASASIPILFESVTVHGLELWDGGLLVNTPLAPCVALGAKRIIPVLVTAGGGPRRPAGKGLGSAMTLGSAIERLADAFLENAYNTDRKLMLERNRLAEAAPERGLSVVQLYEPVRPTSSVTFNAGSYLYFEPDAIYAMYEAGKRAACAWLAAGPKMDLRPRQPDVATGAAESLSA